MKIPYIPKVFTAERQAKIDLMNTVIEDYAAQGYDLSLRQLFYQLVRRTLIPNTVREYANLGVLLGEARMAGQISWRAITDRSRTVYGHTHLDDPDDAIRQAAAKFRIDHWLGQPKRCEIWVEKEALEDVIGKTAQRWDCDYFACKGYSSLSAMWEASRRVIWRRNSGQRLVIIHLGDHDPSGKDMSRDIVDRLSLFAGQRVELHRIALNYDQIEAMKLPPNPAKMSDPRAGEYTAQFGPLSWELDGLSPGEMDKMIEAAILEHCDLDMYNERAALFQKYLKFMNKAADNWAEVEDFLADHFGDGEE